MGMDSGGILNGNKVLPGARGNENGNGASKINGNHGTNGHHGPNGHGRLNGFTTGRGTIPRAICFDDVKLGTLGTKCDVDDTIAGTERLANSQGCDIVNELLGRKGVDRQFRTEDFVRRFQGVCFAETLVTLEKELGFSLTPAEVRGLVLAEKAAVIAAMKRDGIEPAPYVRDALDEIMAGGEKLTFVSSSPMDRLDATFFGCSDLGGFRDRVDIISAETHCKHKKPHPDCYNLAKERTGITTSPHAIAIEDSPSGYESATRADLTCVVYMGLKDGESRMSLLPRLIAQGAKYFFEDWRLYKRLASMLRSGRFDEAMEEFSPGKISTGTRETILRP